RGERRGMEKGIEIGERRGIEIGERRGVEKGIGVGERSKSLDIARRMLRRNRPVAEIVEDTGLSAEDVEGLKAEKHE
ncbi:MAG: hypothetical protein IJU28_00435, partial [Clostridia bacterium]|nr:hypothetical protein [Clostridia bacterium]